MIRALLGKDLRVLWRSPALLGLVVIYPLLIAVGLGLTLTREAPSPKIAVVNLLPGGKDGTVAVGGQTIKLADLQKSLTSSQVKTSAVGSREEALRKIARGELDGALIIPEDAASRLSAELNSGGVLQGPELEILYRSSGPLDGVLVRALVGNRLRTAERALATEIVRVATNFLALLRDGGQIEVFGQQLPILGLKRTNEIIAEAVQKLPESERADLARVQKFTTRARQNLNISDKILQTIAQPLKLKETAVGRSTGRTLSGFAVGVATALSLMLVAMTLAAGLLASEREEGTMRRLLRGGRGAWRLVAAKVAGATLIGGGSALVLLAGVAAFGAIGTSAIPLWIPAVLLAGAGFAGLGVLLGVALRDARAATLAAILLAVPVAIAALVPANAVGSAVGALLTGLSATLPFAAARRLLDAAVAGQVDATAGLQLAAQVTVYVLLASVLVRRARG